MLTTNVPPLTALRRLPAITTIVEAGRFHGISRARTYELNALGELPFPAHKVGERWFVRTAELAQSLGVDPRWLLSEPGNEPAA